VRGDEYGIFWEEPVKERAARNDGPRVLPPAPDTGWTLPEGRDAFPSLQGQGWISLDTETYDPDLQDKGPGALRPGYIAGVSVGTQAGYRRYYPIAHQIGPNLPKEYVFEWLDQELNTDIPKVGARLLYDLEFLSVAGVRVQGPFYDVQVAEPLLDETHFEYSLESIAQRHLQEGKAESVMLDWLKRAFGDVTNIKRNIWRAPSSVVGPYAESDVDLPLRIFDVQKKMLEDEELWDLFILESKLIPMLLAMRH